MCHLTKLAGNKLNSVVCGHCNAENDFLEIIRAISWCFLSQPFLKNPASVQITWQNFTNNFRLLIGLRREQLWSLCIINAWEPYLYRTKFINILTPELDLSKSLSSGMRPFNRNRWEPSTSGIGLILYQIAICSGKTITATFGSSHRQKVPLLCSVPSYLWACVYDWRPKTIGFGQTGTWCAFR